MWRAERIVPEDTTSSRDLKTEFSKQHLGMSNKKMFQQNNSNAILLFVFCSVLFRANDTVQMIMSDSCDGHNDGSKSLFGQCPFESGFYKRKTLLPQLFLSTFHSEVGRQRPLLHPPLGIFGQRGGLPYIVAFHCGKKPNSQSTICGIQTTKSCMGWKTQLT